MTDSRSNRRITRRRLLLQGGQLAAVGLLAGCTSPVAPLLFAQASAEHLTFPKIPPLPVNALNPAVMPDPSLDVKIGQMLLVGFRGRIISEESQILQDIHEHHIGSVVLFAYNIERSTFASRQVKALTASLQAASDLPLFITIDQEGGIVSRLNEAYGFPPTVSAAYLGFIDDPEETYNYASATAETLAALGINLNLAPVVDLNTNPSNPVIARFERSFSADPARVVRHASTVVQAHHDHDVLCTLKHFPGHGSSRQDSHYGFVDVTNSWNEQELEPYRALIEAGKADVIMTAHIYNDNLDTEVPATLSRPIITGILREQLGYNGVVMSDDMSMRAITNQYRLEDAVQRAVLAGVDIIALGNNITYTGRSAARAADAIRQLLADGVIDESRINASYQRIMNLKNRIAQI